MAVQRANVAAGEGREERENIALQEARGAEAAVIVITDADYRTITLPCDALEEGEGPARVAGPPRSVG